LETLNIVLFDGVTTLDALGPVEVFHRRPTDYSIRFLSLEGGAIVGSGGVAIQTRPFSAADEVDLLLVPGGQGTRTLTGDERFLGALRSLADRSSTILSVCTGSALLAKAGILDGKRATSNKQAWDWVVAQGPKVEWIRQARWVVDGNIYTSSGITAGIDMALGFVADRSGIEVARRAARGLEYSWNEDPTVDPFADLPTSP